MSEKYDKRVGRKKSVHVNITVHDKKSFFQNIKVTMNSLKFAKMIKITSKIFFDKEIFE